MAEPLAAALVDIRALLIDPRQLVRAVAAGRRRGATPEWTRVTLRPVRVKAGLRLQLVTDDGVRPTTTNLEWGAPVESTVDALLAQPFGNWHVWTHDQIRQLRVTKRGEAMVHRSDAVLASTKEPADTESTSDSFAAATAHDRTAAHLIDSGDPLFDVIGGTAAKRRQVDAFLRALTATIGDPGSLPDPLRVIDLGCGNAYLSFAAHRYLSERTDGAVTLTGVDIREDQRDRNTRLAGQLGWTEQVRFIASSIGDMSLEPADIVLALHACDTATDDALAWAVRSNARWILAAPCCHHDVAAQLRRQTTPHPYETLTRHAILRERFADVLTDSLRAALLRLHGYRVEVVEFIDSTHTPRNLLLRAEFTGAAPTAAQRDAYDSLVAHWNITPRLSQLLTSADDQSQRREHSQKHLDEG